MSEPTPTELVRELRDAVGLFSGALPITPRQAWDEAIAVAKRAVHEADALREQCAMDDEGHRRMCGPAIEERDALRAVVRIVTALVPKVMNPDLWDQEHAEVIVRAVDAFTDDALVAPDPTSPTDTGDTT